MALATSALALNLKEAFAVAYGVANYAALPSYVKTNLGPLCDSIAAHMETYIKTGQVISAPGTVVGTCPPLGGPLTVGAQTNGTIS